MLQKLQKDSMPQWNCTIAPLATLRVSDELTSDLRSCKLRSMDWDLLVTEDMNLRKWDCGDGEPCWSILALSSSAARMFLFFRSALSLACTMCAANRPMNSNLVVSPPLYPPLPAKSECWMAHEPVVVSGCDTCRRKVLCILKDFVRG